MKKISALLFDLDGTLVDSRIDIANSINLTRKKFDLNTLPQDIVISFIGEGFIRLVEKSFYDSTENIEKAIEIYKEIYNEQLLNNTKCYPGIENMLEKLNSHKLAVISNKNEKWCKKILEGLKILDFFDIIVGGDTTENKKPHEKPILYALKELGVNPENAVMIGDHVTDIQSAKNANIRSCFCKYGIGSLKGEKPDWSVQNVDLITQLFTYVD